MSDNIFTTAVPAPQWSRNSFDLSHEVKMSFKFGQLIPIYWQDIIPGDSFNVKSEIFVRMAPMLAPIMHRVDIFTHYFFVPYRILMRAPNDDYADWENFITGNPDNFYTNELLPYISITNANKGYFEKGDLPDYFGLPVIDSGDTVTQDIDICSLPFAAYQLIWDEFYRDENLQEANCGGSDHNINLIGGNRNANIAELTTMRYRNWEKDYFAGALPTPWAGAATDVELPLTLTGTNTALSWTETGTTTVPDAGNVQFVADRYLRTAAGDPITFHTGTLPIDAPIEIYELRRAEALTRALEAEQRGGKRYTEMLLGVFGVISDDQSAAHPIYLGGGKQKIQISEVLNQAQTLDPTAGVNDGAGGVVVTVDPQAAMAGHGLSSGETNGFDEYFTEHGIVLGIMSALPRSSYGSQGVERYWRKSERFDFFNPFLQKIGDQEILDSEVYWQFDGSNQDDTFGYAPRWAEYKFKNSYCCGDFRDDFDYWHMTRFFTSAPSLNEAFIKVDPAANDELNRIFAIETASVDKLYAQIFNNVRAVRPILLHDIPE